MSGRRKLPACAREMGCLCAFHATGGNVIKPCDTDDRVFQMFNAPAPGINAPRDATPRIAYGQRRVRAAQHARALRNVERVIDSAEVHGRSSDDAFHEAGDLRDFVRLLARECPADAIELALTAYWNTHEEWS